MIAARAIIITPCTKSHSLFVFNMARCYEAFLKLGASISGTGRRFFRAQIAVSTD